MFDDVELALKKNTAMLVLVYVHLCPFNKSTYNAKESLISAPISSIFKHPCQIFNSMLHIMSFPMFQVSTHVLLGLSYY